MKRQQDSVQTLDENRDLILRLLPEMNEDEVDNLVALLPTVQVQVITPPTTGLVMTRVRDCFETDFFLGEILVTRAEIEFCGYRAQATLMGNKPKKTLVAAILEALDNDGQTELLHKAALACQPAKIRIEQAWHKEAQLVSATRVQFESMAEED
jgi:phosphonate C-P lyase system protein PhnG